MKRILLAWVMWSTLAAQAVEYARLPGYHQAGQCVRFAESATEAHTKEGNQAYYVEYEYKRDGQVKAHAVCIFTQKGKWYVVDNEWGVSFRVRGKTMLAMIRTLTTEAYKVRGNGFPLPTGNSPIDK